MLATASTPKGQQANFSAYKRYYAVVGNAQDIPQVGVEVNLSSGKDVTLGSTEPDGSTVPGTTLQLLIQDETPLFSDDALPNEAYSNAFEIRTGSDFTVSEAKNGEFP